MAAEEVGGIQAQITATAAPFFAELQKAEAAAKAFDAKYGKINVIITATLAMPSQTAIRDYQRQLQAAVTAVAPRAAPVPAAVAPVGRGAVQAPAPATPITRTAAPTAVAAETALAGVAVAAPSADVIRRNNEAAQSAAQARANSRGSNAQWTDNSGVIHTVRPQRGGGAVGTGTGVGVGFSRTGTEFGGSSFGPREFAGGLRSDSDFQQLQEDAALGRRVRQEQAQQSAGLSEAQLAQRAAARSSVLKDPVTGQFYNPEKGPAPSQIFLRPRRQAQTAVARTPQVEAAAAEPPPLYVPPVGTNFEDLEAQLHATQGLQTVGRENYTPEEIAEALAQLERSAPSTRRGRGRSQLQALIPRRPRTRNLTPQERAGARAGLAEQAVGPAPENEGEIGLTAADLVGIQEQAEQLNIRTRQRGQQRALGTSLGGFFTAALGGTQARDKQIEADRALAEARLFQKRLDLAKAVEQANKQALLSETDPAKIKVITEELEQNRVAVEELGEATADTTLNAKELADAADAATKGGLRNIGGAFAGALVGSVAFGVGMTAITAGLEAAEKAFGPVLERMTGYQNVAAKLTDTLAEQSRADHGLTGIVVAETLARARLNAETAASIGPLLEQRATVEASNKSFSDQLDLFNAQIAIRNQNQPFGGLDRGLFQTTGGLNILGIQTPIGGTPSTQELIGRQLQQFTPDNRANLPGPRQAGFADLSLGLRRSIQGAVDSIDYLNEQAEKGGESLLHFSYVTGQITQEQRDQADTVAQALRDADLPNIADAIQRQGGRIAIQGGPVNQQNLLRLVQAIQSGGQVEDQTLAQTRLRDRIIPARLFQLAAQGQLSRDFNLIQAGAQRAAQPFLPLGTTVPGGPAGLNQVSPAVGPAIFGAAKLDAINVQRIEATRVQIANLVQPQERAGALGAFDRLQGLGQQAAGLQAFITQSQVNLATAQYNEQLRQARLQLGDLAVLTGRVGSSGGDNLGVLEKQTIQYQRQNSLLQIQLSTLQLELQQRQINFQVAIAGFTAPGVTGAERAARIEQAELEAGFAQEQLDLQKEILANQAKSVPLQIQIQDIQFQRDYTTALNAINLLTQGRQVTIDVAAAQEALQRVNAEIEVTAAEFQTYIQSAHEAATAAIGDVATQMATYEGKATDFFDAVGGAYQDQFTEYMTHIIAQVQRGLNYLNPTSVPIGYRVGGVQATAQTGYYGMVNNPTEITVGEAGSEQVAVLRNPRQMLWNGGGGGQSIVLNIAVTGNNVRSDADLEALTTEVARKVEEAISRRTSLLGFRP